MATKATMEKLKDLVGANDMTVSEIKFVLKHWEDAPTRLHGNVIKSVKELNKVPPAVQVDLVQCSEKAAAALGDGICVEAQDVIVAEFKEDIPSLVKRAAKLSSISLSLWKVLAKVATGKDSKLLITTATVKRLAQRKDCPPQFAKAVGITGDKFEKEQRKGRSQKTRPPSTVKSAPETDDDFTDVRRVAKAVRTTKRSSR